MDLVLGRLRRKAIYDVVIAEYVFMSRALEKFGGPCLKIIDAIDVFSNRESIYNEFALASGWFSTSPEEEARGLNRADLILAIQEGEREYFSRIIGPKQKVVMVGHNVLLAPPRMKKEFTHRLLFVGTNHPANVHGINVFIRQIWPKVKRAVPDVQLLLVGSICENADDDGRVVKMGRVKNIQDAYAMADIVIAPIYVGTGLKIKSIEALGFSKPLVATRCSVEGLEEEGSGAFFVAESIKHFTESVIRLLSDIGEQRRLSREAYRFAQKNNQRNIESVLSILDGL